MSILSPAEDNFVEALIDLGDPNAAAAVAGVQPVLGRDPRIQSEMVDRLRQQGALDAVYARKVLRDLAKDADNDGIRFRAASLLWERGLGKVPDEVNVNVTLEHLDRATLHAEIKQLIADLGMPPLIETDFTEVELPEEEDLVTRSGAALSSSPAAREEVVPHSGQHSGLHKTEAGAEQGPTPDAGYTPDLPNKWR